MTTIWTAAPAAQAAKAADIAAIVEGVQRQLHVQIHLLAAIDSLLHFGSIAFLVTVAYLGIDRLNNERSGNITGLIKKHSESVEAWLAKLEIKLHQDAGGKRVMNPAMLNRHAAVLLYVCQIKTKAGFFNSIGYFVFRQGFVPGLNYFRKSRHILCVAICAIFSGLALFALVLMEITGSKVIELHAIQYSFVALFTVSLVISFSSSIVYTVLNRIMGPQCEWLEDKVKKDIQGWKDWLSPPGASTPPPQ